MPIQFAAAAKLLIPLGNLALSALNYLDRIQDNAPQSLGVQPSYSPPFAGGQSVGIAYRVVFSVEEWYRAVYSRDAGGVVGVPVFGAIRGLELRVQGGAYVLYLLHGGADIPLTSVPYNQPFWDLKNPRIISITRIDGLPDTGGNLPNPNPPISNPDKGLQDSAPAPQNSSELVQGNPLVLSPSALAALLAALRNAANLAAMAQSLADLMQKILDALKELEFKDTSKKNVTSRELGRIRKDGFLRLYPSSGDVLAISLDVQIDEFPRFKRDTYFGEKSPNTYRDLGKILFVSTSFGIISEIELKYLMNSIPVPENALGFYYHLGLDNLTSAKTTCFYLENTG